LFSGSAIAVTLNVSCGDPAAPYHTITAALNFLAGNSTNEFHTLNVTGTCNEYVSLYDRQRITIQASGQTATIDGGASNQPVLFLGKSRNITLKGLVIRGGSRGVTINDSSEVDMDQCTVEYTGGVGIQVSDMSNLRLDRATIRHNASNGLVVDDSSYATVGEMPVSDQLIHIHHNGNYGISVTNSVVMVRGKTIIENNFVGISLSGSRFLFHGYRAENFVRNNSSFGVNISNCSSATFSGSNTIQANKDIGVQVGRGSMASFEAETVLDGSVGYTIIENHNRLGVNIAGGGSALFWGNQKIRGNGFEPESPETSPYRGGFRVATQGELALRGGPEITNNVGQGIWIEVGASVALGYPAESTGATISGNTKEGVLVTRGANLWIASPSTVTDNGIANISCDRSSWVFGDITGIKGIKCENVLPDGGKK